MIKKIKKINTLKNKFSIIVEVFELTPPLNGVNYITGAFYQKVGYPMCAFFESDEKGCIINNQAVIEEEGIDTYQEVFAKLGYIYI